MTWKDQDGNTVQVWSLGKRHMDVSFGMGTGVKIFTSHINEHQREFTVEEDLNHMDKMSCLVDVSQPQFLTQWTLEQNVPGGRHGVYAWAPQYRLSPRPVWL